MTDAARALETHLQTEIGKLLFGMDDAVHALCIALIGGGHVLLEGPPGLGKTRLSKAFAHILGGRYKRIQGTADLMPTDITGVHVFDMQSQTFNFQPGPLFADIVLVDELNRAGPKTQSALLEAMEERQVSVDRETFPLSEHFMVIATQNPREFEGTFPLPESQLDRFALSVDISYPTRADEQTILRSYTDLDHGADDISTLVPLATEALNEARAAIGTVQLADELINYVLDLAAASRASSAVNLGLSMRGALVLARSARIAAALRGGDYVIPDDVKKVASWVVPHRLMLSAEAAIEGTSQTAVLESLLDNVAVPA